MEMFRGVVHVSANFINFVNDNWWCCFYQLEEDDWPRLQGWERLIAHLIVKVAGEFAVPGGSTLGLQYFLQAEHNHFDEGFHVHVVVGGPFVTPRNVCNIVETGFNKVLRELTEPTYEVSFKPAISKKGKYARDGFDFVTNYLMPKLYPNVVYSVTNFSEYEYVCNSLAYRRNMHKKALTNTADEGEGTSTNSEWGPEPKKQKTGTVRGEKFVSLVDSLIERGIFTENKWKQVDWLKEYACLSGSVAGVHQIKTALTLAISKCNSPEYLCELLTRPSTINFNIKENRICKIFLQNDYDPLYAGKVFLAWLGKELGKRNTIWLFGPPTTGKTNIAMSLATAVPSYGMVNWNNENFPFNDVPHKSIILWDEGLIKSTVVEAAKAILGGQNCRVDQKNKGSVEVQGTPVLITSNNDMTRVVSGNTVTLIHQRALKDRMVEFDLTVRCSNALGLIPAEECKQWLFWSQHTPCDVFSRWKEVCEFVAWKSDRTGICYDFSENEDLPGTQTPLLNSPVTSKTSALKKTIAALATAAVGTLQTSLTNNNWESSEDSGSPPRSSTPLASPERGEVPPGQQWELNTSVNSVNALNWPMYTVDWVWGSKAQRPVCCLEHDTESSVHCSLCLSLEVLPMLIENSINQPDVIRCSAHAECTNPFDVLTCKKCRELSALWSFVKYD
ncbi:NS protein [Pig-tailed macaque parvovirus]|uniref:NS protein n=1 Tax=Pig-tailed macaque parvovirus TaxID=119755 RepID=Q9J0X5_9VIRU|nr:NS protein [Pig-tailed macaque parvovirus]AAF61213.1 NS protein [Pig-tailed macaque parvovirus]